MISPDDPAASSSVLLARALCATKKLLLDEPVTGLDPVMTNEMYQLIRRINREQNVTIIMVSRYPQYSAGRNAHSPARPEAGLLRSDGRVSENRGGKQF